MNSNLRSLTLIILIGALAAFGLYSIRDRNSKRPEKLFISISDSNCQLNGKLTNLNQIAEIVASSNNDHRQKIVTIQISDDLSMARLMQAAEQAACAGAPEVWVTTKGTPPTSATIEFSLLDMYKVHWQYTPIEDFKPTEPIGYNQEHNLAFIRATFTNGGIQIGESPLTTDQFRETLQKQRASHDRVAVILTIEGQSQKALPLIKLLALIEHQNCKTALISPPDSP